MENKEKENKASKGLADSHDGDLILNESGTSVNIGHIDDEKDENVETSSISNEADEQIVMSHGQVQNPYDISDEKNREVPKD